MAAPLPTTPADAGVDLTAEIEALSRLDRHGLRVRWRTLMRSPPSEHLGRALLLRLLAYKLQARAYGDLDRETARYLAQIERERVRRRRAGEGRPKAPPPIPPVPASRVLKPGTLLVREYGGVDCAAPPRSRPTRRDTPTSMPWCCIQLGGVAGP